MERQMIGIDLHQEHPKIYYYEKDTQKSGLFPMKIGNARVGLAELFSPEQIREESTAETLSELLKEVFRTFGIPDPSVAGLALAAEHVDLDTARMLQKTCALLGIQKNRSLVLDYKECFFYYMAYQEQSLWTRNAALCSFEDNEVQIYRMSILQSGRPQGVLVRVSERADIQADKDQKLYELLQREWKSELFSSIFITGDGFHTDWAVQSSKEMFRHAKRIFTEEGLFAKGACNAIREKLEERRIQGFCYAGDSVAKYNIGMDVQKGERISYHPIIVAGGHWFETSGECELILGDVPAIKLLISNTESGGRFQKSISLDGLPERPGGTTRLKLHLEYISGDACLAEVTDLGFGEFFASSSLVWREVLEDMG